MDTISSQKIFKRAVVVGLLATLWFLEPLQAQVSDTLSVGKQNARQSVQVSDLQDLTKDGFNFWQDKFTGHFAGVGVGFNTFLKRDYSSYNSADAGFMDVELLRSNSVFLNLFQKSFGLQFNRNTMGLVTGIGLQLESYRFEDDITIVKNQGGEISPEVLNYDRILKSKLSSEYLFVPLLVELQIPLGHYANRLYFSAGTYGGLHLGSRTRIKYTIAGRKEILKKPDNYSIQRWKTGLMVQAGYRRFNVFARYDLTPFFEENKGPKLTPVTIGVMIVRF